MADSELWRKLAKKFRKVDPSDHLWISWAYSLDSRRSYYGLHHDQQFDDVSAQFNVLAIQAGREIDANNEPLSAWCFWFCSRTQPDSATQVTQFDPALGRDCVFNYRTFRSVARRSATLCTRLQAEALTRESIRASPIAPLTTSQFPTRAAWLKKQLKARGWDHNRLAEFGGPDRKTTKRILSGLGVHEGTLDKLIGALNKAPGKHPKIQPNNIPND